MAADPSQGVSAELLPHVHLVSTYRYASMARVDLGDVTKWLLQAPKIARDTAPFYWTYLDAPTDGSIFLTWQPSSRRGTDFASDGYVWAGPEVLFQHNAGNGLVLEIYSQRAGYRMGEPFTAHSRRRFRLAPPQAPVTNLPQIDPNLWIVHYGPSEKPDRLPVNSVGLPLPAQQILNMRQHLFQMGQIQRKDFMLSDRVNWPQIPFPGPGRGQAMYAPPMQPRPIPQAMAYPPHGGPGGGSGGKRQRGAPPQPAHHQSQMMAQSYPPMESAFDDDEDISRGDMFDHVSPRELAVARYQQNHEWMEEVLSSPYRIGQIEVSDIGLGRKGELASLTEGIFEAQGTNVLVEAPKKPYTGHLDPGLADEFRRRVHEKNAAIQAEIDQLKAQHAKMLAKFRLNGSIKQGEAELRSAAHDTGNEFWRLEGRPEDNEDVWNQKPTKSIDEIVSRVEAVVGKPAAVVHDVHRVHDGGYQEPAPEPEPEPEVVEPPSQLAPNDLLGGPSSVMSRQASHAGSQHSGVMIGDSDIDMGGTAASMLDQMHHTGLSSTSTPINNFPTPQPLHLSAIPSSAATPAGLNVPSPAPTQAPTSQPAAPSEDIQMEDAEPKGLVMAPDQGTGSGEWVVVPKGGLSPTNASTGNQQSAASISAPVPAGAMAATTLVASVSAAEAAALSSVTAAVATTAPAPASKPASSAPTPGDGLGFDGDNNDFSSLGDLDTAGDALAGYDPPSVDAGELGMEMEDSAFGDAFHGVEVSGRDDGQDIPADGL